MICYFIWIYSLEAGTILLNQVFCTTLFAVTPVGHHFIKTKTCGWICERPSARKHQKLWGFSHPETWQVSLGKSLKQSVNYPNANAHLSTVIKFRLRDLFPILLVWSVSVSVFFFIKHLKHLSDARHSKIIKLNCVGSSFLLWISK